MATCCFGSMMAGKLKTVRERGGDLKLAHISSKSQRLLGMMKLLLAFETFDDEASAIKSFAWKGVGAPGLQTRG